MEAVYKSFGSMRYTHQNMKAWSEAHEQMWGVVGRVRKLEKDMKIEAEEAKLAEENPPVEETDGR